MKERTIAKILWIFSIISFLCSYINMNNANLYIDAQIRAFQLMMFFAMITLTLSVCGTIIYATTMILQKDEN